MENVKDIAAGLLASGEVKAVIGYGEGSAGRVRPLFATDASQAAQLVYDKRCVQNLAMYIYKKEIAKLGKPAIVGGAQTVRSVIRLAAEKQLTDGGIVAIAMNAAGEATVCRSFGEMEAWIAANTPALSEEDAALLARLEAMSAEERQAFWQEEMEHCMKCYACRQACPLCYCTQCTVEMNQPQWISVAASSLGNMEWHIMRAMHLSGRCVECGECGRACPVNIPIHLLTMKLAKDVRETYGTPAGFSVAEGCAMSTFKPDDKENFIG